jgi:diguanylate cyclase (GGDEF)-like protein
MTKASGNTIKTSGKTHSLLGIILLFVGWAGALFALKYLPVLSESMHIAALAGVEALLIWGISLVMLRDPLGRPRLSVSMGLAALGAIFAMLAGGVQTTAGMVLYAAPLLYLSASLTLEKVFLLWVVLFVPEMFLWYNVQNLQNEIFPWLEFIGEGSPWSFFIWNAAMLLWMPLVLTMRPQKKAAKGAVGAVMRKDGLAGAAMQQKNAVNESSAANQVASEEKKNSQEELAKEGNSSDEAVDLKKLDEENAAMRQRLKASKNSGQEALSGVLDSIIFFVQKNFRAHSALGFLSLDGGRTFVLNAHFCRGEFLKEDVIVRPGSGLVGRAVLEGHSFMSGNVSSYSEPVEYYSKPGQINSIMVSLVRDESNRRLMGLLVVDSDARQAFSDIHKDLMERFSQVAARLISHTRLSRELEHQVSQQKLIYEVSRDLAEEKYTKGVINVLFNNLSQALQADRVVVCTMDPKQGDHARVVMSSGENAAQPGFSFPIRDSRSLYGEVIRQNRSLLESDIADQGLFRFGETEKIESAPAAVLAAPLLDENHNCVAVLGLESDHSGVFDESDLVVLQTIMANASSAFIRARFYAKMEQQATIDGLTKIPNHRHFQDTLAKGLAQAKAGSKALSLLLMDIDHFKNFNDTYGHPLGDRVLQEVAKALKGASRKTDFPARYGGEEFVVILGDTDSDAAISSAERVRQAIEAIRIPHEGKELSVTVSVGSATYPQDAQAQQDLIDRADQAMYYSKEHGRNQCTLYQILGK